MQLLDLQCGYTYLLNNVVSLTPCIFHNHFHGLTTRIISQTTIHIPLSCSFRMTNVMCRLSQRIEEPMDLPAALQVSEVRLLRQTINIYLVSNTIMQLCQVLWSQNLQIVRAYEYVRWNVWTNAVVTCVSCQLSS